MIQEIQIIDGDHKEPSHYGGTHKKRKKRERDNERESVCVCVPVIIVLVTYKRYIISSCPFFSGEKLKLKMYKG